MTKQETNTTVEEDWKAHAFDIRLQHSPLECLAQQKTLVTIVIPTHNYGHLISETVDSVLQQTHKNLEIIVVDDGSTDNTENVVMGYPQIKYVYQEHRGNHTPARAANHGLQFSHGEFIICLGADDKLIPTYVEKCLEVMLKDRRVGIVFTGTQEFGASDKSRFPRKLRHKYSILRHPHGQLGAMMVRRSVYFSINAFSEADYYHDTIDLLTLPDPAGLYDEHLHSLDDWDFAIRASLRGWKIKSVPHLLHQARVHQGRVTGHANESELFAKYPYMKSYIFLSRLFDISVLLMTKPKLFVNRFCNKVVCRLFQILPRNEPPTSFQHEWVNEKKLLRKILQKKPSVILDCGCGVGRWGYLLRGRRIVGVEIHKPYLLKAKRYEEVICASAACLPFQPLSFHVGLGIELIEHLPKQEGFLFLQDIRRVCSRIILTTPKNFEPIDFGEDHPETHKSHWSKADLVVALK